MKSFYIVAVFLIVKFPFYYTDAASSFSKELLLSYLERAELNLKEELDEVNSENSKEWQKGFESYKKTMLLEFPESVSMPLTSSGNMRRLHLLIKFLLLENQTFPDDEIWFLAFPLIDITILDSNYKEYNSDRRRKLFSVKLVDNFV